MKNLQTIEWKLMLEIIKKSGMEENFTTLLTCIPYLHDKLIEMGIDKKIADNYLLENINKLKATIELCNEKLDY